MNNKQQRKLADLINGYASPVKFYEHDCEETDEEELCRWSFEFDGDYYADKSDGRYGLESSINDYLIWSHRRIRELEAQLANKSTSLKIQKEN